MAKQISSCAGILTVVITVLVNQALAQTPCCMFNVWEGHISQKTGVFDVTTNYASLADIQTTIHVDGNLNRLVTENIMRNGSTTVGFKLIEDFNQKVSYTVVGMTCIKTKLVATSLATCIPENAVHLGTHAVLGIKADNWFVPMTDVSNKNKTKRTTRITVSEEGCIPLHEVVVDIGDTSRMSIITYQNVTKGIVDPKIFDIPDFCNTNGFHVQQAPFMHVVGHPPHSRVKVF